MSIYAKKISLGDAPDCDDVFVTTTSGDTDYDYEWFFQTIRGVIGGVDSVDLLDGEEYSYEDLSKEMQSHYDIAINKIDSDANKLFEERDG